MKHEDETAYTDDSWQENLLGITQKSLIDQEEARGFALLYEAFIPMLTVDTTLDISLILELHKLALGHIYHWAGKWRRSTPTVGSYLPPSSDKVPMLMAEYAYYCRQKLELAKSREELAETLAYAHHRLVWIHPFVNGNGRTARVITDILALIKGYNPVNLYHRQGEARNDYISALRNADKGDYSALKDLLLAELATS